MKKKSAAVLLAALLVIGELVMEKLKTLDEVAYVRFASVYRSFTDLNNFAQELENMIQREKKQ